MRKLKCFLSGLEERENLSRLSDAFKEEAHLVTVALSCCPIPGDLNVLATEKLLGVVHPNLILWLERYRQRKESPYTFLDPGKLLGASKVAVPVRPVHRVEGTGTDSENLSVERRHRHFVARRQRIAVQERERHP